MSARFGPFMLDTVRRQLLRDGAEVHLTPKAFDLLARLIDGAPRVIPKSELHPALWPDTFVSDATLVGLVKEVRRALGDRQGKLVRTAHRVGYAFAGAIEADNAARPVTHWIVAGARRIALRVGENLIGRDPAATVWLDTPGVSRRHARVCVESGSATLEDLGSKNGTLLCDRPVRGRMPLQNASRIQVATELLVFHVSGSGVSTATQSVAGSSKRTPPDSLA